MRMTAKQLYVYLLDKYGDTMLVDREDLRLACDKTLTRAVGSYSQVGRRMPMLAAEDLIQAGVIGLVEAIRFFDPGKGRFWPYAQYIIRKEIFAAIRKNSPILSRYRWHGDYPIQIECNPDR